MKTLLVAIVLLSGLPAWAAEPPIFAPTPFKLEAPVATQPADTRDAVRALGLRVDLPVGPVRIDYGFSIRAGGGGNIPLLDAPGVGYREQRAQAIVK